MADNKDNHISREGWYLSQIGRARGLIVALEIVRNQERGLRPLSTPIVGHGRAEVRALLLEAITRNPTQAPNPVPCQTGRGRGLGSPPSPCTTSPLAPNTAGLGRARSRTPGPCPHPGTPIHIPNSMPQCLCLQGDFPNPLTLEIPQELLN